MELGGGGTGCSLMRARRFDGVITPGVELRLPKGDSSGSEVILSCSTCMRVEVIPLARFQGPAISHHEGAPSFLRLFGGPDGQPPLFHCDLHEVAHLALEPSPQVEEGNQIGGLTV